MKILICDDHALFRAGLRLVLRDLEEATALVDAASAEEMLQVAASTPDVDLVLMDLGMPGMDGFTALATLRERFPALPVVIVSASERRADVRAAMERGASGFIPKSSTSPVLLAALRLILSGGVYVPPLMLDAREAEPFDAPVPPPRRGVPEPLTPRQLEVLDLVAAGRTNREIREALGIAEGTVKAHIATILETLGAANRAQAVAAMHARRAAARPAPRTAEELPVAENVLRREGEYWTIRYRGSVCRLRDSKGLRYLAYLLQRPNRECHALEVAAEAWPAEASPAGVTPAGEGLSTADLGDAGEILDTRARSAYKARLRELDADLETARAAGDAASAARLEAELAFLSREVAGAVGLGGRERRAASAAERARLNVTRALRAVLEKLDDTHPDLARHLGRTLRTGSYCAYEPDPSLPVRWTC